MIRVFYGEDRVGAKREIQKILGDDYEVLDGAEIETGDLPSIFLGASLFSENRKILIRDFTTNKAIYDELPKYLKTPHEVILFEIKLDKRAAVYKELQGKVEFREFKTALSTDYKVAFEIYRVAKRDGRQAVQMLETIRANEDPIKFMGLLVSQAMKDFKMRQGVTEKAILRELARVDMKMKTTKIDPWLIVESFLLKMNSRLS